MQAHKRILPSSPIKNRITLEPSWQPQEKKTFQRHKKPQSPCPYERTFIPPLTERRTIFRLTPRHDAHRQFLSFISSLKTVKISPESQGREGSQTYSTHSPFRFNKKDPPPLHERTRALDPNHKKTINTLETPPTKKKNVEVHIYLPTVRPMRWDPPLSYRGFLVTIQSPIMSVNQWIIDL